MEYTRDHDDHSLGPKPKKAYGFACQGCKKRKAKCDGTMPVCKRCARLTEPCVYERKPRAPVSLRMAFNLIRQNEKFLRQLSQDKSTSEEVSSRISRYVDDQDWFSHLYPDLAVIDSDDLDSGRFVVPPDMEPDDTPPLVEASPYGQGLTSDSDEMQQDDLDEILLHLSMDDSGKLSHFGPTSMLYQRLPERIVNQHSSPHASGQAQQAGLRVESRSQRPNNKGAIDDQEFLGMTSAESLSWETLAYNRLRLDFADEAEDIIELLQTYFSWQYGGHCVIYKPCFFRDMALEGTNFNYFLLNTVCANAARYTKRHQVTPRGDVPGAGIPTIGHQIGLAGMTGGVESSSRTPGTEPGAEYLNRAKLLLHGEMDKPSSVPTIQGLILLGQRECACGNLSQGWMYTGMAFRAMRDLGIHLDCNRSPDFGFGTLSAEDREIRRRLFWSAFTWDKVISLALGRAPTFNAFQNASPGPLLDHSEDDVLWTPYCDAGNDDSARGHYPPAKSYTILTFEAFSSLCEIVQGITQRIFTGRSKASQQLVFIREKHDALDGWYTTLPTVIKLDVAEMPEHCPPPHIFNLNTMYRTAWILLYKLYTPFGLTSRIVPPDLCQRATAICNTMATELHLLFKLYAKTFNLRNMTYTLSYSMYAAATIHAINFGSFGSTCSTEAAEMLPFALHVLDRCRVQSPGVKRSIDIIKRHFLRSGGGGGDGGGLKRARPADLDQDPAGRSGTRLSGSQPLPVIGSSNATQMTSHVSTLDPANAMVTLESESQLSDMYLQIIYDNWQSEANPIPQRTWDMDTLGGMTNASMGFDWNAWNDADIGGQEARDGVRDSIG